MRPSIDLTPSPSPIKSKERGGKHRREGFLNPSARLQDRGRYRRVRWGVCFIGISHLLVITRMNLGMEFEDERNLNGRQDINEPSFLPRGERIKGMRL
jgi:hypothetical protein